AVVSKTERNQRYRDSIKHWLMEYRSTLSCEECGENHPACLSFHHVDPSQKKYKIAEMPNRGCSIKLIKEEIAKCIVLCHNCHAKHHFEEEERPFIARRSQV